VEKKINNKGYDNRIVFLDYLRIFAFITVLVGHKYHDSLVAYVHNAEAHGTARFLLDLMYPLIQGGGAGVVIFFLVSGYIITHVLQAENTIDFIVKRIFRIYPLYIVAVLVEYLLAYIYQPSVNTANLWIQLSLMGDFFSAPHALKGVEWTLRIEILFYFYMAVLNSFGLFKKHEKLLPYVFVITIGLCSYLAPIPSGNVWSKGYLTIYGPFLLLGSVFYLLQKKVFGLTLFFVFVAIIFYHYFSLIEVYQKHWRNAHFAFLAFLLFLICWKVRNFFTLTPWVVVLSDLTYAVYLFHNWLFQYLQQWLTNLPLKGLGLNISIIGSLLVICYIFVRLVEKPGIKLGRLVLKSLQNRPSKMAVNSAE
jgi:peptidoglycan/LPS O-acetylase OafA/YrhL